MRRLAVVVLLFLAGSVRAQDVPLEQLLLPKEGWHEVTGIDGKPVALASDGAGNLYVADADKKLLMVSAGGEVSTVAKTSDVVGGLTVSQGSVHATLPSKRQIVRYEKGKEVVVHEKVSARDLLVSGDRTWYTSPEKKSVFLAGRDEPVATDLADPSGLTLWKGSTLVVGDAAGRRIYAFRVLQDGGLDGREPYCAPYVRRRQSSGVRGFARDTRGMLYAATKEGVQVFDRAGRLSGVLDRPARAAVTGVAFGGEGKDQLFILCDGKLWRRKLKAIGLP